MIKTTILHDEHLKLKAKMAPFGGFDMPIQYEGGIIKEHLACRQHVAIFDTCHMGKFKLSGKNTISDLEKLLSCNLADLAVGRCRYGLFCNPEGGVIDDQVVYRLSEEEVMIVVNAGTQENDYAWIKQHLSPDTKFEDLSPRFAKLDIQGPEALRLCQQLLDEPMTPMVFYSFSLNAIDGQIVLISRTGYTGEAGLEIYCPNKLAVKTWQKAIKLGATPAGLGARDTLRLEMGLPLYGHEMNEETNAYQSGFTRSISTTKNFIGSQAVLSDAGKKQKLVGLLLQDRRAARAGMEVKNQAGKTIGRITSGSYCPSIEKSVALAYVDSTSAELGTEVAIVTERANLKGTMVSTPFYQNATGRKRWETLI